MKQPKGLGRGLDAIFGTDAVDAKLKPMSQMSEIDITEIIPNPTQPRTQFDEEALDELADSIRQLGVISRPISARWTTRTCTPWPSWRISSARISTP